MKPAPISDSRGRRACLRRLATGGTAPSRRWPRAVVCAGLLLGLSACGERSKIPPPQPLDPTQPGALRLDTANAVTIGAVNGAPEYTFGRIGGVVVGPKQRIYVAASMAQQVRVYSPTGHFLFRFGHEGDGPGEFRSIEGIAFAPNGRLAVYDADHRALEFFTAEGRYLSDTPLHLAVTVTGVPRPLYFDNAGGFYLPYGTFGVAGVDSLGVIAYAPSGTVHDTLRLGVWRPPSVDVRNANGLIRQSFSIPFATRPVLAVGVDGRPLYSPGNRYEVLRLGRFGDTMQVIRGIARAVPVSAAMRDSAIARLRDEYRKATGRALGSTPRIPADFPVITGLYPDHKHRIWILSHTLDHDGVGLDRLDVFGVTGRLLARLPAPRMQILQIADSAIAGIVYDSLGVPFARVIPLHDSTKR